jgi:prepilin-type processing-associated H-X9-DG protein
MQKITPFLWLDGHVGEAIEFYRSVFKKSKVLSVSRNRRNVQSATLRLNGQELILFNGGPHYKLTPAFSLMVQCQTQKEVDYHWAKLTTGGEESRCGWLVDKFGLSWQVVPEILFTLLNDKNPLKSGRSMAAMLKMRKLDIKALKRTQAGL